MIRILFFGFLMVGLIFASFSHAEDVVTVEETPCEKSRKNCAEKIIEICHAGFEGDEQCYRNKSGIYKKCRICAKQCDLKEKDLVTLRDDTLKSFAVFLKQKDSEELNGFIEEFLEGMDAK